MKENLSVSVKCVVKENRDTKQNCCSPSNGLSFILGLSPEPVVVGWFILEAKKAMALLEITGDVNFENYRLMLPLFSNCLAAKFVSDSYALTACCPPPSQEEVADSMLHI